jgi:DNA (cytosine-5)-methyltransferase 1
VAAYYNEIDPYAAQWLRNLIARGLIAPGDVDTRSICDIPPNDLKPYTQCHFFAGIGVWSHALRLAGWPDDEPVWTGSCPCQPFSVAGANAGMRDERHLWPYWFWLIEQRRPRVVFGEQVEAAIRHGWLDLVQADMEGIDYTFAAAGIPAAGFGAFHIRQRIYFVADSEGVCGGTRLRDCEQRGDRLSVACNGGAVRELADAVEGGRPGASGCSCAQEFGTTECGGARELDDAECIGRRAGRHDDEEDVRLEPDAVSVDGGPRPTHPGRDAADWLRCRDGKWRPVEPGTFPLAHGSPARVGRLRAYGNAIEATTAANFVGAYAEARA